jgi:hypothetical protein
MPSQTYCNSGDTATVTFPDGAIRDFIGPVEISTTMEIGNSCQLITVAYQYYVKIYYNNSSFIVQQNQLALIDLYAPVTNIFIKDNLQSDRKSWGYSVAFSCRGNFASGCVSPPREIAEVGGCCSTRQISTTSGNYARILSAKLKSTNANIPLYRITVANLSGTVLFSGLFNNNNYTVTCKTPCPPNTLDCGDCCLPCDEILTKVCILENLFIGG